MERRTIRFSTSHEVGFHDKPVPDIDADEVFSAIFREVREYTMTDKAALFALYTAVCYVLRNNIPGDFVECGVWKGGSALLAGLVLQRYGVTDRALYLYDTFEGMTPPDTVDIDKDDQSAQQLMETYGDENGWCYASYEEVAERFAARRFLFDVFLKKGDVLDTLGDHTGQIAILRLDTDWFASTKFELERLYPMLSKGGLLIIDDYGHWRGSRMATDAYFAELPSPPMLIRVNESVRLAIKL